MKKQYSPDFFNQTLKGHISRIINNFKSNPENLEDSLPSTDYIADNGAGEETWVLDVPNIEESYLYSNEADCEADYATLRQLIDLMFTA